MSGTRRLTDAEVAEIRRRRPAMRASLACEGLYPPDEVEALFDQLEAERLPRTRRAARIVAFLSREAPREGARRRVKQPPYCRTPARTSTGTSSTSATRKSRRR